MTLSVDIAVAGANDLETLDRDLPLDDGPSHARCLASQDRGRGSYLIARNGGLPVGRCFLRWFGNEPPRLVDDHPAARRLIDLPEIGELFVAAELRSQGIGTLLVRRALLEAGRHGAAAATLCVDADNPRARALYERLGFVDSGLGVFTTGGTYTNEHGDEVAWQNGPQSILVLDLPVPRRLTVADAEPVHALRREALEAAPLAFGSSPEDDRFATVQAVGALLSGGEGQAVFGLIHGDELVGMAGGYRNTAAKERHKVGVWGMYVRPAARRRGGAARLLDAIVEWARRCDGVLQVHISVTDEAPSALALYRRAGFVEWGVEPRALRWHGTSTAERHLVLDLDR